MKTGKIIGIILVVWGVGGLALSLPPLIRDKFARLGAPKKVVSPETIALVKNAMAARQSRPQVSSRAIPDSIRVWKTLSKMDPKEKKIPDDVASMMGKTIEVAGFLIFNEGNADDIREFLLTPVPGGCVHVPPPPPNYIMHVLMAPGHKTKFQYGPVVVRGKVALANSDLDRQSFAYEMTALSVTEYVDSDTP